jgi:hypothetical protein
MKAWCITDSAAILQSDLDASSWTFCKRISDNADVLTTGTVLYNYGGGHYILDNPNVTEDTIFQTVVTIGATQYILEGAFSQSSDAVYTALMDVLNQMLAGTYQAGVIRVPGAPEPGAQLIFFEDTDVDEMQFTLSPYWIPYLEDPDTTVWFTMKVTARDPVALDAQCVIYDAAAGVVRLSMTASQMNIKPTSYFWQLQVRKSVTTGVPPVTTVQRRMAQEGTALVKPTYKQ